LAVVENRDAGDLSTMEDAGALQGIRETSKALAIEKLGTQCFSRDLNTLSGK